MDQLRTEFAQRGQELPEAAQSAIPPVFCPVQRALKTIKIDLSTLSTPINSSRSPQTRAAEESPPLTQGWVT